MSSLPKLVAVASLFLVSCGNAEQTNQRPALSAILHEPKFEPHGNYTGSDTPDDREPLQSAVDRAISDIGALPDPLDKGAVRDRLVKLIDETDLYATEDRDEVGRYAVRIWRAAGFKEESRLYPVSDERILGEP